MEVMDFFRLSAGRWRSQRTTHHLPFRRTEMGDLEIYAETLDAQNEKIVSICEMHDIDATLAVGGAFVRWHGSMEWDTDGEGHEGETGFALVPDADNPRQGRLLRERGYAEVVPVVGQFILDNDDGLILITEYETMSSVERFWFPSPDLRLRTSTVKRFGGFNTASFCAETRLGDSPDLARSSTSAASEHGSAPAPFYSIWGW
jgi:hypothetical protein